MSHFISIFGPLAIFSFACVGVGLLVLSLFRSRPQEDCAVEYVIAFVMGQGVLGSLFLVLALIGIFTKPLLLGVLLPLTFIGLWKGFSSIYALPSVLQKNALVFIKASFLWQLLAVAAVLLLLSGASAVVGRIDGDARAFYLALPKVVAASHRLIPLPAYEGFTSVGLLAEMQLAALFLLDMPGASPRLFSWVISLAGAVLLIAISRNAGLGRRGQLLSLVMLSTSSAVAYFWGQGKTDLFAAVFALPAVLYALKDCDNRESRRNSVTIAGVFTGFALVAKLSYIVAFLPSMFVLLFWKDLNVYSLNRKTIGSSQLLLKTLIKYSFVFVLAIAIPLIPHLLKNHILLNTLVDTYGNHHYFSDETTRRIVYTYLFWPFFGSFWAQYGNLSPLMLAFFPLLILMFCKAGQWSSKATGLFVAGATGLLAWIILFPGVPMPRYFLATLLLFTVPAAWAMERASYIDRWINCTITLASLATILVFYVSWSLEVFRVAAAYEYFVGDQSEKNLQIDEVLSRNVYESLNQNAGLGARVYLGSYYRFWLRPDLIQCTNGKKDEGIAFDSKQPEKFWIQIYQHGFTYMFMDNTNPAFAALNATPNWVRAEMIYPQSGYGGAYRLSFSNPPADLKFTTREVAFGAWDVVSAK
ncbi:MULTISPECIES: hypothetical protein [Methylomonas]|uniref:Glycosyltransferase RgtA/B/C/D-like domain-containing protein n=2 Tax=Methylomonas TaxID=416 RepID=A0A140E3Y3_9GAMM|nr:MULTISPECIES: hypothetical protein [Methylomonas]AMK75107.1 hypothetical protein JT25_001180 [Methylomonas denitrificans]OAI02597.1 hypothetical protein A1342_02170 [Methylomonas methanica]TCV83078.1 hypothetical protein EDE11_11033 [Methylomonas methanica]